MSDDRLTGVLADLRAESDRLDALVADLPDQPDSSGGVDRSAPGWRTPTPAAGWDVAHQIAHLAWTDETAVQAATDQGAWDASVTAALADPDGFVDAEAATGAAVPAADLLARWRAARARLQQVLADLPAGAKLPWYGPSMSATSMATARFMETWAHARDVAAALGVTLAPDARVRHVVHLGVRTRGFSFVAHGLPAPTDPVRVELALPDGSVFVDGPAEAPQSVRGSGHDFALLVTQRAHRADLDLVATGPDADRWLDLAQAFAGPPGTGRPPKVAR